MQNNLLSLPAFGRLSDLAERKQRRLHLASVHLMLRRASAILSETAAALIATLTPSSLIVLT